MPFTSRIRSVVAGSWLDARFAGRRLWSDRWLCLTTLCCLALGAAGIISVAKIADAVWFGAPRGVTQPSLVRRVFIEERSGGEISVSPFVSHHTLAVLAAAAGGRMRVAEFHEQSVVLFSGGEPRLTQAALVSPDYYDVLGLHALVGQLPSQASGALEAVVSFRLARSLFVTAAAALGRTVQIGGRDYAVAAVLPEGYLGTEAEPADVWLDARATGRSYLPNNWEYDPVATVFRGLVRLADSREAQELTAAASRALARDQGTSLSSPTTSSFLLTPLAVGRSPIHSDDADLSRLLVFLSVIVWLAVCTNVSGLLLVRASARSHESAVCLAFGASPCRVTRVWAFEICILAAIGAVAGLEGAVLIAPVVARTGLVPASATYQSSTGHIALATGALAFSIVTVGLLGTMRVGRHEDLAARLTGASRSIAAFRQRTQRALLVAQLVASMALVYVAALYTASFRRAVETPLGFNPAGLYVVTVNTSATGMSVLDGDRVFRRLADRFGASPGVRELSIGATIPFVVNIGINVNLPFGSGRSSVPYLELVTPRYFRTLGMRVVAGRDFDANLDGRQNPPVVIVSTALARELFGDERPLGQCIIVRDGPCRTVVGVVNDVMRLNLRTPVGHVYVPLDQALEVLPTRALFLRLDAATAPTVVAQIRLDLQSLVPGAAAQVIPISDSVARLTRPWRLSSIVLTYFSVIALAVLAIGVFGTVSYWAAKRRREIAIRAALGAEPIHLSVVLLKSVAASALAGALLALAVGIAIGRAVSGQLFVAPPIVSLPSLGLAFAATTVAAALALVHPMMAVARTDPLEAMRD
jgi:predicted permease